MVRAMDASFDPGIILFYLLPAFLVGLLLGFLLFRGKAKRAELEEELQERETELAAAKERNLALEREAASVRDQVKPLADEVDKLRAMKTRPREPAAEGTPSAAPVAPRVGELAAYDPGRKLPTFLDGPEAKPDDLSLLKGVGAKLETAFRDMGVYYFAQIADWSPEEVKMVDAKLGNFRGRIERDQLIEQAKLLAAGRVTEYEARFGKLGTVG